MDDDELANFDDVGARYVVLSLSFAPSNERKHALTRLIDFFFFFFWILVDKI
jgi:hypothetical protein